MVKQSRDTGRFQLTPPGEKTPRMRQVEKTLGRTLEEDFQEYYVEKGWGQKRLAARWGVQRPTIFATNPRRGRRSWVQMLHLPVRRSDRTPRQQERGCESGCEICGKRGQVCL